MWLFVKLLLKIDSHALGCIIICSSLNSVILKCNFILTILFLKNLLSIYEVKIDQRIFQKKLNSIRDNFIHTIFSLNDTIFEVVRWILQKYS